MKGFYIGVSSNSLPACNSLFAKYTSNRTFNFDGLECELLFNPKQASQNAYYDERGNIFVMSGWCVFRGQRVSVDFLAESLLEEGESALKDIDIGAFLISWWDGSSLRLITDRFGLHPHFIDTTSQQIKIAPSIKSLITPLHKQCPVMVEVLEKCNHLFGNFTIYKGVERLEPGAVTRIKFESSEFQIESVQHYSSLTDRVASLDTLGGILPSISDAWDVDERILPISAGLDSRFLLANSKFGNGFTYGPDSSPERIVGKHFSNKFNDYEGYDFSSPSVTNDVKLATDEICFGQIKTESIFLANYIYITERFPKANAFFDGYLGDTLQRGTYINFKGAFGELLKLLPLVYYFNISAEWLLKKRYSSLSEESFSLLLDDFRVRTNSLPLDDYQKLTWYEFIYGRGGRYIVCGSNLMVSQFFDSVCFFTHSSVFNSLINQDFKRSVTYRQLNEIWLNVSSSYKDLKTESGYTPITKWYLIPPIQLFYRLAFHFIPGRENYGVAMKKNKKLSK